MLYELLLPLVHRLGRAVRNIFWSKGELGQVTVQDHKHEEELHHGGGNTSTSARGRARTSPTTRFVYRRWRAHMFSWGGGS